MSDLDVARKVADEAEAALWAALAKVKAIQTLLDLPGRLERVTVAPSPQGDQTAGEPDAVVHFLASSPFQTQCGRRVGQKLTTNDPAEVTCGGCKQTARFAKALADNWAFS